MHLFWSVCNFDFNLLLKLRYQAEQAYFNIGAVLESYNASCDKAETRICFLYKNLSLPLILFITFEPIDSPERVSSSEQPRYVTA